jgi:four helix bundle protein
MNPHDELRCFHASYDLAIAVVKSTEKWPKREMFGLSAQARRAATSIPINIAEGAAKRGRREFVRYLDIALGSLAEINVILRMARDLNFMPPDEVTELEARRKESARQVWKLYRVTQAGNGRPSAPPTA